MVKILIIIGVLLAYLAVYLITEVPKDKKGKAAKVISEHNKACIVIGCDAKVVSNTVQYRNQWKVDEATIDLILKKLESPKVAG